MRCPNCNTETGNDQRHCPNCGQYIPQGPSTSSPAGTQPVGPPTGSRPGPQPSFPPLSNPTDPQRVARNVAARVARIGSDNFRLGLLTGLAFLAIFLLLETLLDRFPEASAILFGIAFLTIAAFSGLNLWNFIQDRRKGNANVTHGGP